jgi:S-adenosylmethionine synthetase
MPLALDLAHKILQELAAIRKEGHPSITYLRPDAKAQVTIAYDDKHKATHIDTIVLSTQHDEFADDATMHQQISYDIKTILIPKCKALLSEANQALFNDKITYHINPTGKFVIGGPHGDTGLTGRKIIVDTYGGRGAHGGGAFSGKDPSKVDRSAAYAARHIAKNLVASGVADQILVQVAYAIGVAHPVGLNVNSYGTGKVTDARIEEVIKEMFDMRPSALTTRLNLKKPIYSQTAAYGHVGRLPGTITYTDINGVSQTAETFTWEKLDYVDALKKAFNL